MEKQKNIILILVIIIIALVGIIVGFYIFSEFNRQVQEEPEEQANTNSKLNPSFNAENLVSDYIKENISALSPEPEVLGGTYYVTSINFSDSNIVMVDYEDGHIAHTAKVEFEVSQNGEVNITSFDILPEDEAMKNKINFQATGNIVEDANGWKLVYEQPGKPALTVRLIFDQQVEQDWQNGDRVSIQGIEDNGNVRVIDVVSTIK